MEVKELIKKDESSLHKILADEREKMRVLRFKDANKQLKNIREIREIRKTISRILTLLNAKGNKEEKKVTEKDVVEEKK